MTSDRWDMTTFQCIHLHDLARCNLLEKQGEGAGEREVAGGGKRGEDRRSGRGGEEREGGAHGCLVGGESGAIREPGAPEGQDSERGQLLSEVGARGRGYALALLRGHLARRQPATWLRTGWPKPGTATAQAGANRPSPSLPRTLERRYTLGQVPGARSRAIVKPGLGRNYPGPQGGPGVYQGLHLGDSVQGQGKAAADAGGGAHPQCPGVSQGSQLEGRHGSCV